MAENRHEVIIIGGGVTGASIAWHLVDAGMRDILILEREAQPGAGSTARANGGIRAQFTTSVNIELSLLSMDILDLLADDIGDPPVYQKAGYLFLTAEPEKFAAMHTAAAFQQEHGVAVEILSRKQLQRHGRYFFADDLVGGTFHGRRIQRPRRNARSCHRKMHERNDNLRQRFNCGRQSFIIRTVRQRQSDS